MKAWTDYPITELGDAEGQEAPIRECEVISYDGDKYCDVIVGGVLTSTKCGYLYSTPGRFGEAPRVTCLAGAAPTSSPELRQSIKDRGLSET